MTATWRLSAQEISKKVQESRLKWYGLVLRREDEYVDKTQESDGDGGAGEKRKTKAEVNGLHRFKNDLSERKLSGEEAEDRAKWRRLIRIINPT